MNDFMNVILRQDKRGSTSSLIVTHNAIRMLIVGLILIFLLTLTGCSKQDDTQKQREESFNIIAELCQANFAPQSKQEYEDVFKKYSKKQEIIDKNTLITFFDYGNKDVKTDVTMVNYVCHLVHDRELQIDYYEAKMRLKNSNIHTDIRVMFYVNSDGQIYKTLIKFENK